MKSRSMTIGKLLEVYLRNHVAMVKDRRAITAMLRRYLVPFMTLPLSQLKRVAIIEWHQEIGRTRGHGAADNALLQLHAMYGKARDWEMFTGSNPADRIKKFPRKSRTRFVRSNELPYLLVSLSEEFSQTHTFFLHLLLTGARLNEVRTAKWGDLDLDAGLWHKPTTKTGVPHTVPLPHVLIDRLRQLPRTTEWVYSSQPNVSNGFQPRCWSQTTVEWCWRRIRARAGLPDVQIRDLRRTCASWLAIHGENLSVIQQTLNHSSLAVTQVYARLTVQPVRRALDAQASRMLEPPQPVPLRECAAEQEWPG